MNKIILFLAREKRDLGIPAEYCKGLENSSKITCSINTANRKPETWPSVIDIYFSSRLDCFFVLFLQGKPISSFIRKSMKKLDLLYRSLS